MKEGDVSGAGVMRSLVGNVKERHHLDGRVMFRLGQSSNGAPWVQGAWGVEVF